MDAYAPDGTPFPDALARTRRIAVVAHPDDAEVMALSAIGRGREGEPFALVVCTDGAGAPVPPGAPSGPALAAERRAEQRRAADFGEYAALVQLGLASDAVRGEGWQDLVVTLAGLLASAGAEELLTHAPTDRHPTHVAVAAAAVAAARRLEGPRRPARVLGGEVWGALDWLPADVRVARDTTGLLALGRRVLGAHRSQLRVKAYERAAQGRRVANATFADPRAPDGPRALELMMDLTPAIADDGPTLAELVARAHADAAASASRELARYRV